MTAEQQGFPRTGAASRIERIGRFLRAHSLSPKLIIRILEEPHRHWQRIVRVRNGRERICYAPQPALAKIQRRIARFLLAHPAHQDWEWEFENHLVRDPKGFYTVTVHRRRAFFPATAFAEGCSIIANAKYHRRNRSSWCLDLKGAFGQIKTKHVYRFLIGSGAPFEGELSVESSHGTKWRDAAWVFARLLTYRGRLRQGSPASPLVFNLLMRQFDREIAGTLGAPGRASELKMGIAWWKFDETPIKPSGIIYTRYGDDLCFSAPSEEFPVEAKQKVREVLAKHGLRVTERKIQEGRNGVMEFPGVVVVRGVIRPRAEYLAGVARQIQRGSLTEKAKRGHRAFLQQFGRSGRPKLLRRLALV